jgi:hypothetical protein
VSPGVDRELELGADAVVARDQQRILVTSGLGIEKPAEPTDLAVRTVRIVALTSGPMAFTSALPASIETPACS